MNELVNEVHLCTLRQFPRDITHPRVRNLLNRILRCASYVTSPRRVSHRQVRTCAGPLDGQIMHDNDKGLELLVNPGSLGEDTKAEIRD